jgi:TonB family protein
MGRQFYFRLAVVLAIASALRGTTAQEPALFNGAQAIRYPESPGYVHYVLPCKQTPDETSSPYGTPEPAICWPVRIMQVRPVDGKLVHSQMVEGMLVVSSHGVRFRPNHSQDTSVTISLVPQDVEFRHLAGQQNAILGREGDMYALVLPFICAGCEPGQKPSELDKPAQLDLEFDQIGKALRSFDTVYKRITDISSRFRVAVNRDNQPADNDPPGALRMYADLNNQFAAFCAEPARRCVETYATYQSCKAAGPTAACGERPTCSADCVLTRENFQVLRPAVCETRGRDSWTISPDWAGFLKRVQLKQETPLAPDFPPPHVPNGDCSVAGQYWAARNSAMFSSLVPPQPVERSSPGPTAEGAISKNAPVRLSGDDYAAYVVKRVMPEYPAVARHARVEGSVVLHARISKEGEIEDLDVVSGPALLCSAALDAVRQWRFKPFLLAAIPVEVDTTFTVNFNLKQEPAPTTPTPAGEPR